MNRIFGNFSNSTVSNIEANLKSIMIIFIETVRIKRLVKSITRKYLSLANISDVSVIKLFIRSYKY